MPVIDETVVIARPAGEVFDFLMLAENLPLLEQQSSDAKE
jgi:hypothetical protein